MADGSKQTAPTTVVQRQKRLRVRLALGAFLTLAAALLYVTSTLLTQRFTETTRNQAEIRMALYTGNVVSELQRNSVVPLLLSQDPVLVRALNSSDYSRSSQQLISYLEEIGSAGFLLLDQDGRAVAATDRNQLGTRHRSERYFIDAVRANDTVFSTIERENGAIEFTYSRRMVSDREQVGVIVVFVDLAKLERSWAGLTHAVMVADSTGRVILATEPRWRGESIDEALARQPAPSAIRRALNATAELSFLPPDAYLLGEAVMQSEARIPFQGWRMTTFTNYQSVRERVNGVLALEIMGLAMFLALAFYVIGRRERTKSKRFQRESAELRQLNQALQREIAERKRAEKNL
ncbi:MAG: sensor histidine kinase, partial [Pseudomonadota bacterium]